MDAKVVISAAAIYIFIYYFLGKYLIYKVKIIDASYFLDASAGDDSFLMNKSVIPIIFDERMPKSSYPVGIKSLFFIVKAMLLLSPLMFLSIFFLL